MSITYVHICILTKKPSSALLKGATYFVIYVEVLAIKYQVVALHQRDWEGFVFEFGNLFDIPEDEGLSLYLPHYGILPYLTYLGNYWLLMNKRLSTHLPYVISSWIFFLLNTHVVDVIKFYVQVVFVEHAYNLVYVNISFTDNIQIWVLSYPELMALYGT